MIAISMTAALLDNSPHRERPSGIRNLAIVCFVLAGYMAVSGTLVLFGAISLISGRYLLGDYATMGPVIYYSVAVAFSVVGVGLYKGWRIVRRLAIILAALLVATSLLPISAAVTYFQLFPLFLHGIKVILTIMAIRYLLQPDVVEFFNAKSVPPAT